MPIALIRSAEAAALLGMTQKTFNRKALAGEIPAVMKLDGPTGPRLFDRSVIVKIATGVSAELKAKSEAIDTAVSLGQAS